MKTLPFNLKKALAGYPVVTRTGLKVTGIKTTGREKYCIKGRLKGRLIFLELLQKKVYTLNRKVVRSVVQVLSEDYIQPKKRMRLIIGSMRMK